MDTHIGPHTHTHSVQQSAVIGLLLDIREVSQAPHSLLTVSTSD